MQGQLFFRRYEPDQVQRVWKSSISVPCVVTQPAHPGARRQYRLAQAAGKGLLDQWLWKGSSKVGLDAALAGSEVTVCRDSTQSMTAVVHELLLLLLACEAGPQKDSASASGTIAKKGRMRGFGKGLFFGW